MKRPSLVLLLLLAGCALLAPHKNAAPEFPGEALRWRSLRWLDENGRIPAEGWRQALAARERNLAASAEPDFGGIAPAAWIERGPFNLAGRSRTLVIDPRDPTRLWSGGVSGGLWTSGDSGTSWSPVDDWWTNLAICSLTMDPSDPDVMYVGTGEGFYNFNVQRGVNSSAVRGAGIFKTTDGGQTWTHLTATQAWPYVCRVAVSPGNPNVVLAAVRPGGVMRSTDGGQSWSQVLNVYASYQVLFDPNDASKALAHGMDQSLAVHSVAYSTDAGATWTTALSGLAAQNGYDARVEMAYAASSPGIVYASVGNNGGKVWRSADGGRNWVQRTGSTQTAASWYYNGFWVDPTDENVMVVTAYHVWRSTDGGVTLQQITDGYIMTTDPHLDVHHVTHDPRYNGVGNRRVYVTTDGGVHVADDILTAGKNRGWRDLDNGQRSTQFYGAAGHGGTGVIVAGAQDNGTQRLLGGNATSTMTFGGDGGFCQIDPTNANYVYGEYVWLQVHRSTNGGGSASFIYNGITEASNRQANFVAPLVLDPNAPRRLYGGAASLWRTDDSRASQPAWRAVKPAVGSYISAIAVAPGNPDLVWVGHNDGRVYRTTNGTAANPTWTAVDDNAGNDPLPDRYVGRLLLDPANNSVVYAALGGFTPDNFWRSTDGGQTWADATGSGATKLPPAPINGIARHPDDGDVLYVATEVGIYATDDGAVSWSTTNDGPANVVVDDISFMHQSRTLLAATLGRGLWTADVRLPSAVAFGSACQGQANPPVLSADPLAMPRLGETTTLVVAPFAGSSPAQLLLGLSNTTWSGGSLPASLAGVGMPGCQLLVRPDVTLGAPSAGGAAQWSLPIPLNSTLLGAVLYGQAAVPEPGLNPLGVAVSQGLTLTVGW